MQEICGHKEGVEGGIYKMIMNFLMIQILVLVPVHGLQAVVLSAHQPPHTWAEWRVKTTKEKCGNISRRMLGKKGEGATIQMISSLLFRIWRENVQLFKEKGD